MTGFVVIGGLSFAVALAVGWALPRWVVRTLLVEGPGAGHTVPNYRGRRVSTGLGLVFAAWVVAVAGGFAVSHGIARMVVSDFSIVSDETWRSAIVNAPILVAADALPLLLVAGAGFLGFIDDRLGDSDAKGFRGHLSALARGRLTTGGLKMLGIGALALYAGLGPGFRAAAGVPVFGAWQTLMAPVGWALAALTIALAANLVNLTDLRPGRAIKTYSALALTGGTVGLWTLWQGRSDTLAAGAPVWMAGVSLCLAVLVLGPVAAVWSADLGERGMLGDAGANAMGALAGYLLVWGASFTMLVALAVLLLALNLASERVSFSKVIAATPLLSWIDGIGRLPEPDGGTGACGTVDGGTHGDVRTGRSAEDE